MNKQRKNWNILRSLAHVKRWAPFHADSGQLFFSITATAAISHPQTQSLSLKIFCRAFIPFPIVCRKKREKSTNCQLQHLNAPCSRVSVGTREKLKKKNEKPFCPPGNFIFCFTLLATWENVFSYCCSLVNSSVWISHLAALERVAEQRTKLSSDFYQLLISSRVHGTLNSILFCENLADFTTHARKWRKNEKVDWEWCHKKCEWEDDTNEEAEDLHEIYDFSFRSSFTYYEVPHIDEGLTFFSGGANGREWRRKKIYIKFNSISSSLYLSSLLLDRQYNAFRFHSLLFFRLRCRSLLSAKGSPIRRRWIRKISFYSPARALILTF